jgi:predicted transcriptional regulator
MAESTSIKLRDGLRDRLKKLAADSNQTTNQLMNEAINDYVERKERRKAYLAEAEARWTEYKETGERISLEEAEEMLDRLLLDRAAASLKRSR